MVDDTPDPLDPTAPPASAPRRRRSVRWILTTVALAIAILVLLAMWLATSTYVVEIGGRTFECDALVTWGSGPEGVALQDEFDEACDHQQDKRRTTALLLGVGVATVACAVSTVPSRRLTQESVDPDIG